MKRQNNYIEDGIHNYVKIVKLRKPQICVVCGKN